MFTWAIVKIFRIPSSFAAPLITFLLALGIYLLTIAPDLTWAHFGVDGGELVAAATTLGIPHPPGYPIYVLLGKLFSLLPLGTIPLRFNLFSAVSMAVAAAFVTAISQSAYQHVSQSASQSSSLSPQFSALSPSVTTGLTFAFAPLVWSQAVITEVYALNLACLALFLWLLLTERRAFWAGVALGISMTTHLSSALMLPLALWGVGRGRAPHLFAGFLLGLTPFLLLPLFALNPTPVVWGDPTTLPGWLWGITGRLYASNVLALPLGQWGERLTEWGFMLLVQFSPLGLPLLVYGLYRARRGKATGEEQVPDNPATYNPVAPPLRTTHHVIIFTAFSYFFYAFTYTSIDAIIFWLPGLLLLSILLTFGLERLGKWGWVLPLLLLALNFDTINLRDEVGPRPRAIQLLQAMPQGAILLSPGDETIFTLWALQQGEGVRPDLILVDNNLFAFAWYRQRLAQLYPQLAALAEDNVPRFRAENQNQQPVCEVTLRQPESFICYGLDFESNDPQSPPILYSPHRTPFAPALVGAKSCSHCSYCPITPGAAAPG